MKKYAGENKEFKSFGATISIQYGKQEGIENKWKEIIAIEDKTARNKQIDLLIELMEKNAEQNGFFTKDQKVTISMLYMNCVLFDDKEMYYQFFEVLRNLSLQNTEGKLYDGAIIKRAIEQSEKLYWGGLETNRKARLEKTSMQIDDDFVKIPSVKDLKGQNCSACVERSAMSHNLWLLTGKTSYFINASNQECNFGEEDDEYKNDGHAFNIVEYGDVYRLFDISLYNFCILKGNPIEDIENEKPLKVEGKGVQTPGYYANYSRLENEQSE